MMVMDTELNGEIAAVVGSVSGWKYLDLRALRNALDEHMRDKEREARADLAARIAELTEQYGITLEKKKRRPRAKPDKASRPTRYANPENPEQRWSGVGAKPKWLRQLLEDGASLDDFRIAEEAAA
jgi:DNA-binding protein H-NS